MAAAAVTTATAATVAIAAAVETAATVETAAPEPVVMKAIAMAKEADPYRHPITVIRV